MSSVSSSNYPNNRSSGTYNNPSDYDSRHHGRWTASGEARDFDSSRTGLGGRSFSDHDRRDRDYDRDYDRNRGYGSNYGSNYGSGFGSGLGNHYGYDFGYGSHPSYGMGSGYSHPSYGMGSHYGSGFGSGLGSHFGSGFGSGYNSGYSDYYGNRGLGSHYGSGFGSGHYGSGYGMGSGYGSYGMGYPSHFGGFGNGVLGHPGLHGGLGGLGYGNQGYHASRGFGRGTPEVDIFELGNDYIIEVDLPGHSQDHIKSEINGNQLLITSRPPQRKHDFHINERSLGYHDVNRRLYLPQDANAQGINATLTNGVLRVVIPRHQATTLPTTGATTSTTVIPTGSTIGSGAALGGTTVVKDTTTTTTETRRV